MPLIETLAIEVGSSIAKSVLKLWLKDNDIISDASSNIVDMVKSRTTDRIAQRKAQRQFEEIGEKVGQSLLPLFEAANLDENDRTAVAMAVADTLNTITGATLAQNNLEPETLAKQLLQIRPAEAYHFNDTEALLYRRSISEACIYVIDIAAQLPMFSEQTFAEVLKRETQILAKVDEVLHEIQLLREQHNPQEEAAHFELNYRQAVKRNLEIIELFGANVKRTSRTQNLSVAYVRLSVEQKVPERDALNPILDKQIFSTILVIDEDSKQVTNNKEQRSIVEVDEALSQSTRLLIRGPAGSGKTTLMQWIAVNAAAKSFQGRLKEWNRFIPFYVRLRYHLHSAQSPQLGLPSPEEFPGLISQALADAVPAGWARGRLSSGRAIVLVDGIDEIPETQRLHVRTWLQDLIGIYPNTRYVLTSRPTAVEGDDWTEWLASENFQDAVLQPMSLHDIFEFIDHWHAAVSVRLHDEQEKAELPGFAQHLKQEIERNKAKRELATSPLLCAILCALNRDRRQQLPSDRIKLYEACCELLIEERDKARNILLKDYPAATLSYSQKLLLLQDLAYWMMKNDWSNISQTQADERFQRKLGSIRNLPQALSSDEGGTLTCKFFVERSSILRDPFYQYIDFTHRTFQEFLAAGAALDEGDIGVLVQNAHNDQWREVILLASGLARKKTREDLIEKLLERGGREKPYQSRLHLLAATCLEASVEDLEPQVRLKVQECLSALIPPKSFDDARVLATVGELAVPYLARNDTMTPEMRANCVHALALIGGEEALNALEGYTSDTSKEVVQQLWRVWTLLEEPNRKIYAQHVLSHLDNSMYKGNVDGAISIAQITSLDNLQYCKKLTALSLKDCGLITDLSPIASLTQLQWLCLWGCELINDLSPLASLTRLYVLLLHGCEQTTDLSPLASLTWLQQFFLLDGELISDLSPLASLSGLSVLFLWECKLITNLSPLASLTRLLQLSLLGCEQTVDLSPLASLTHLRELSLGACKLINDLSSLASLVQLQYLDLRGCELITDLSPLSNLSNLTQIVISPEAQSRMIIPESLRERLILEE